MKTTFLNCEYCDKEFEAKRNDAQFCSSACKQQAYLKRKTGGEFQHLTTTEKRKQVMSEFEGLLNSVVTMWDMHIKNEANHRELARKVAVFREAHELLLEFNSKYKSFIDADLYQLPPYRDLLMKVDDKNKELTI